MIVKAVKWMIILEKIDGANLSKLSKNTDVSYSHITNIINEFIDKKWVMKQLVGRENKFLLTQTGLTMQKYCTYILEGLEE